MDWQEIKMKSELLQSEGKTEEEAAEMLKDEIRIFVKECVEHPGKVIEAMPDLSEAFKNTPIPACVLLLLLFQQRGGWGLL